MPHLFTPPFLPPTLRRSYSRNRTILHVSVRGLMKHVLQVVYKRTSILVLKYHLRPAFQSQMPQMDCEREQRTWVQALLCCHVVQLYVWPCNGSGPRFEADYFTYVTYQAISILLSLTCMLRRGGFTGKAAVITLYSGTHKQRGSRYAPHGAILAPSPRIVPHSCRVRRGNKNRCNA